MLNDLTKKHAQRYTDDPAVKADGGDDKLMWDLLPVKSLEDVVRVYNFGARKYSHRNWEKGMK